MTVHSRVAPSSLALTVACNASLTLQEQVPPSPPTEEELEGDAAHAVTRSFGDGHPWAVGDTFTLSKSGAREWRVDADMVEGAQMFLRAMGGYHSALRVEDGVSCEAIHPTCFGTPDAWRYFAAGEYVSSVDDWVPDHSWAVLRLGDYKYGYRFVDEFENFQLIAYAVGILSRLGVTGYDKVIVEFIIVQPRCFAQTAPVRIWRVAFDQLRALINIAYSAAEAALGPNPIATTGAHCMDCRARHACNTLRYASSTIVSFSGAAQGFTPDPISMGVELRMLREAMKQLEARETGLAQQVESLLRSGAAVPLWTLKPGNAPYAWNEGTTPAALAATMDLFGIDIRKPPEVKTPRQVIDMGVDEAVVAEYATRQKPKMYLKLDTGSQARKIFSGAHTVHE